MLKSPARPSSNTKLAGNARDHIDACAQNPNPEHSTNQVKQLYSVTSAFTPGPLTEVSLSRHVGHDYTMLLPIRGLLS